MLRAQTPAGYPNSARARSGLIPDGRFGSRQGMVNAYDMRASGARAGRAGFQSFGYPTALPIVPANAPESAAFAPVQPPAARPTYDLAGMGPWLGPWWHVPLRIDYQVLIKLREAIPLLDGVILRMKQLIGFPEIEAAPRLKRDIDSFLENLPNNRMLHGGKVWLQSHLNNGLQFGRAHAEVLLTATRRDVHSLLEVHPATTALRPTFNGYATDVVQYQHGGGVPVTLAPELLLTSVHDFRGDDPNGTSFIGSLPFVAEILNKMLRGLGATWDRFGVPIWHVNWEPPDTWNDPTGDQARGVVSEYMVQLNKAMLNRANGKTSDVGTSGKATITIMGADGETLEFSESARTLCEQVTAKTGIPPFLLGFSWSASERMTTAQAKTLTEVIQAERMAVESALNQLIDLRQRLVGRTGRYRLVWQDVSLQDLIDTARADWMESQSEQIKLENWDKKVRLGIRSLEEMAVEFRDDLKDVPLDEVRERLNGEDGLPKLEDAMPDPVQVQVAGMRQGPPGDPPGGNNPRDESVSRALVGNGNGRH